MRTQDETFLLHPAPEELDLAAIFRALADPTRLAMFVKVAREEPAEFTCSEFCGGTKQLNSHHLRLLREAGLTSTREEGRKRYIRIRRDAIEQRFPGLLDGLIKGALQNEQADSER